jgi:predicted transcriptional regulator
MRSDQEIALYVEGKTTFEQMILVECIRSRILKTTLARQLNLNINLDSITTHDDLIEIRKDFSDGLCNLSLAATFTQIIATIDWILG